MNSDAADKPNKATRLQIYAVDHQRNETKKVEVSVSKDTTASQVVRTAVDQLAPLSPNADKYFLAEVCLGTSGQSCVERQLLADEYPLQVQLLWPNSSATSYQFQLCSNEPSSRYSRAFSSGANNGVGSFVQSLFPASLADTGGEFSDLCSLPDLTEETLTDSLVSRFEGGLIYTYVGSILIAINPYKFFPIYNPKYVNKYRNRKIGDLPPHIFAIADAAFHSMLHDKTNQCVVISGESGSGKTQSTHLFLHQLTALSQKGRARGIEQTLLAAGPVLEAFGNAKTVVNNNSSRFGKFIQVNYKENGVVHGAIVEKYLLEKSRIVSLAPNERNYHIFYYLLAGASDQERETLYLTQPEDYYYLNQSGCYTLEEVADQVDEKYEFSRLKQSMEMVGFSRETMRRILAVLSAVLHLGNVSFRQKSFREESVVVENREALAVVSRLLYVEEQTLLTALTSRKSVTSGDHFVIQYKMAEAVATRDAVAKCLYSALFDWIVMQVNHGLMARKEMNHNHQGNSIGVLDIFGFENCEVNGFEQFCINFANEHLQYYFNQHVFKFEQDEYVREGIQWKNIDFIDNTGCLNLISKKPTGLLHILDDDCSFPAKDTNGYNLRSKFANQHKEDQYFEVPQIGEASFIILHYADKVKYQIKEFREKNNDMMRPDVVAALKNSSLSFVRELVGADPVAVFRWAIVRAFFRSLRALIKGGKNYRNSIGDKPRLIKRPTPSKIPRVDDSGDNSLNAHETVPANVAAFTRKKGLPLPPDKVCYLKGHAYRKANKIIMRNRSFSAKSQPKSLRDLNTMKKLAGRTLFNVRRTSKKIQTTVSSQFQFSLNKLMETLNQAHPYFIRCIKSNNHKAPCKIDRQLLKKQLRYTGTLETVRIRQSGYNIRLSFKEFSRQYKLLLPKGTESSRDDIKNFLDINSIDHTSYQLGHSKVFLRESERGLLQERLHEEVLARICLVQRWWRAVLARRLFLRMREAALLIQCNVRSFLAQQKLQWLQDRLMAAICIQATWRGHRQAKWLAKLRRGTLWFQCIYRANVARRHFEMLLDEREEKFAQESINQEKERDTEGSDEGILKDDLEMERYYISGRTSDESGIVDLASSESEGNLLEDELSPADTTEKILIQSLEEKEEGKGNEPKARQVSQLAQAYQKRVEIQRRESQLRRLQPDKGRVSKAIAAVSKKQQDLDYEDNEDDNTENEEAAEESHDEELSGGETLAPREEKPPEGGEVAAPSKQRFKKAKWLANKFHRKPKKASGGESPGIEGHEKPPSFKSKKKEPKRMVSEPGVAGEVPKTPVAPTLSAGSTGGGMAGNMNVTRTAQWKYPTHVVVGSCVELKQLDDFILNKLNSMESSKERRDTIMDVIFKKAMREYHNNLLSTYSIRIQNEQPFQMTYGDLLRIFEDALEFTANQEQASNEFPVTLGVNAFRGYLDKYMSDRKTPQEQPKPVKSPVKNKKKKHKDDAVYYLGHKFVVTQFSIPTACEHCSSFLWLMEKAFICQTCKFTCHKKCYTKVAVPCRGQSGNLNATFGMELDRLVSEEVKIPVLLEKCIDCIEKRGINTLGIYRKAGAEAQVKELKATINSAPGGNLEQVNFDKYNVLVISQVLKSFFRELPEPLLTFDLYPEFMRATDIDDQKERIRCLFEVVDKLPPVNRDIFERLIFHLARVASHESYNKMSANSLSIVFAPSMLQTNRKVSPLESLQDVGRQSRCLESIITEQVKKIKSTLADISTLEKAQKSANQRISTLSLFGGPGERNLEPGATSDPAYSQNKDLEEVEMLAAHIRTLEEEKDNMTAELPLLQTRDSMISASEDEILSSSDELGSLDNLVGDTLDNQEYAVTFDEPANITRPLATPGKTRISTQPHNRRPPSKFAGSTVARRPLRTSSRKRRSRKSYSRRNKHHDVAGGSSGGGTDKDEQFC